MEKKETFYTLPAPYHHQQEIRKSIFLAQAFPVSSIKQAMDTIQNHRDPEATHNCWAYRIGQHYRSDDDGEPSGTAGRPILQVIEKQNYNEVLVIVTRWFGGIKLGAGGLIRAYSGTAAECLRQAPAILYIPQKNIEVTCSFSDYALVKSRIAEYGGILQQEDFCSQHVSMNLTIPEDQYDAMLTRILDITRGQALIKIKD